MTLHPQLCIFLCLYYYLYHFCEKGGVANIEVLVGKAGVYFSKKKRFSLGELVINHLLKVAFRLKCFNLPSRLVEQTVWVISFSRKTVVRLGRNKSRVHYWLWWHIISLTVILWTKSWSHHHQACQIVIKICAFFSSVSGLLDARST